MPALTILLGRLHRFLEAVACKAGPNITIVESKLAMYMYFHGKDSLFKVAGRVSSHAQIREGLNNWRYVDNQE